VTEDGNRPSEATAVESDVDALERVVAEALDAREAAAFVHVGSTRDPSLSYCRPSLPPGYHAVAFDGREWRVRSAEVVSTDPADALATDLADAAGPGTVLAPSRLPHDAALYLEDAGFSLASANPIERARATKSDREREQIATAQTAASAGVRRAATVLDDAVVVDGHLAGEDNEPLTTSRLRAAVDETIVEAGGFPAANTEVEADSNALIPGEPIVVRTAPLEPMGYHGGLARTFVVDGDGGPERRAHVGVTQSFRSAAAMLTADSRSVGTVEADLAAEVRAFGFDEKNGIDARVVGVGLDTRERPWRPAHEVGPGSVVRLDVSVGVETGRVHVTDLLAVRSESVEWIDAPSRSLDPATVRTQ
jgi:Xaa-Pro aminopeptidase